MQKVNNHTLYQRGAYGANNVWEIWSVDNVIHISANGSLFEEVIHEGKAGKTIAQQVELRVNARVRGKLDGGFKRTPEEAASFTNQLNLPLPMLAKKIKDIKGLDLTKCYIQNKLDGHRCIVTNSCGELLAYTRRGKLITTIGHILKHINIPEGYFLDGELYCHGESLQTIASWSKRKQPNTLKLEYHVYDFFTHKGTESFGIRLNNLMIQKLTGPVVKVETTFLGDKADKLSEYFREARQAGYEGLIVRPELGKYEHKRSNHLIKVKEREDGEFDIIDIIPSRLGLGILVCKLPNGKTFKTNAPGDNHQKKQMLINKEDYIGKQVTCEYSELTKEGKPFHCVAIRIKVEI